ncbi:MAG: ATP-binding protein [Bryobacteraceae bacterium]
MSAAPHIAAPAARITPGIAVADSHAAYWMARVILTLRAEVCWCWRLRDPEGEHAAAPLPPAADAAGENLDLVRYESEKARFFQTNSTARYLHEQLERLALPPLDAPRRGSWAWAARELALDDAAQFLLGLVLAARLDAGIGPVLAACMNDRSRPFVTLSLAQRLWPDPLAIAACADSSHPLFRAGLIHSSESNGELGWLSPLDIHPAIARQLADPGCEIPRGLRVIENQEPRELDAFGRLLAERLAAEPPARMEIVPLIGPEGAAFGSWAASLAAPASRRVAAIEPAATADASLLAGLAALAWLRDLDLLLPESWMERYGEKHWSKYLGPLEGIPVRWCLPVPGREALSALPHALLTPPLTIRPLTFEQRGERLRLRLGEPDPELAAAIEECSRRFRFQESAIDRVAGTLRALGHTPDLDSLIAACRNEAAITMGALAQAVNPRFAPDELVLPPRHREQFEEIITGMRALTEVHYRWGTARVWNESGLSVLFSGPPGTGKTMAAEALSTALRLPMYRVDLSQVVNKYIGETEKNLKRIFDAAELSDCILFFDEADALFGKRTEVKDSHDRFANIEVSYLLERMERFKGLAILATNRKKDIDEAFLRRLRYVIEFPMPGVAEREQIWRRVFPPEVDASDLDFGFLARQFTLAGGYIRSIAFAACLQSAGARRPDEREAERKVTMETVLVAVKRELEKMNRAAGEAVFGRHGATVREGAR